MDIKPRVENWPFYWGDGSDTGDGVIALYPEKTYLFPEFELPKEVQDLQKLVEEGVDFSVSAVHLGDLDTVLTGREFMNTLYERGIEPEQIGAWSAPPARDKSSY